MKRAVVALAASMSVLAVAACEESTSGADRVRAVDAGDASPEPIDGGATEAASPVDAATSACVTCAREEAADELRRCGEACDSAIACIASCVSTDCESRCLRDASTVDATRFKVKLFGSCSRACPSIVELVAAAESYGSALCERAKACSPALAPYRFPVESECPTRTGARMFWASALPGSWISPTQLRACATTIEALGCADYLSPELDLACVVRGRRLVGEPCLGDAQCETGFCPSVDGACATCTVAPADGDACVDGRCAPGLRCTTTNVCVRTARSGDACADRPCEPPATCQAGVCAPPSRTVGDPCGAGTRGCDNRQGFVCPSEVTPPTCSPFVAVPPGGACGLVAGTYRLCHHALACTGGTCPPTPSTGDPCTSDAQCHPPDRCIASKCTALPPLDACP